MLDNKMEEGEQFKKLLALDDQFYWPNNDARYTFLSKLIHMFFIYLKCLICIYKIHYIFFLSSNLSPLSIFHILHRLHLAYLTEWP